MIYLLCEFTSQQMISFRDEISESVTFRISLGCFSNDPTDFVAKMCIEILPTSRSVGIFPSQSDSFPHFFQMTCLDLFSSLIYRERCDFPYVK